VGVPLSQTRPDGLRFYLGGEMSTAAALYELLAGSLLGVALLPDGAAPQGGPRILPPEAVRPAGFGDDEAVLPAAPASHPAYRLLQEYFTVPRKFLFLDVEGLADHGAADHLDLVFILDQRPRERLEVGPEDVRLGCVPVANLFARLSEPVRVDQRRVEYRLIADARRERSTEIHSIQGVQSAPEADGRGAEFQPFHSFSHGMDPGQRTFWHARRAPAERGDLEGTDVFLSFLDLRARKVAPPAQTVWARVLCTNRRLAEQLLPGALQLELAAPVKQVRALHPCTPAVDPPLGGQTQWRLVSHLSLNHLSLSGGEQGLAALREILRLYAAWGDPTVEAQVQGIRRMECRPAVRRAGPDAWRGFCRGTEIDLTVDDGAFAGCSALLLASVLDRFLALYAAVNSFTRLSVCRQNREGPWKTWPARVGGRALL
jgi:type VI secretion system protein ImpG